MNYRAVLLTHPGAAMLRGTRLAFGPNTLRLMQWVCAKFLAVGFSETDAAAAGATIFNYTMGCLLAEVLPGQEIEASVYSWED